MSTFLSAILFLVLINILALVFAGVFFFLQLLLPWLPWGVLVVAAGVLALPLLLVFFVLVMLLVQSKEQFEGGAFFPKWESIFHGGKK